MRDSTGRNLAVLIGIILVTELVPSGVQALTAPEWTVWYAGLAKPAWNPPNWVFPVVWPTLYLLMSIAAWLVWRRSGRGAIGALLLYGAQLLVNASWTWVFAGLKNIGGGFYVILVLWALIVATSFAFRRHSGAAAALMLPYLAWVTFAGVLNLTIWGLNG